MEFSDISVTKNEDMEKLREVWSDLQTGGEMTAFQDYGWNVLLFEEWHSSLYNRMFSEIHIFSVNFSEGGGISKQICLIPVIIQKHSFHFKWLGRSKGIFFLGTGTYSDYINFIYKECPSEEVFDFIFSSLKERYPDLPVYLDNVRDDTALSTWCKTRGYKSEETPSVFVRVESDSDLYTAKLSRSTRQNLRTAKNRMNRDGLDYCFIELGCIKDRKLVRQLNRIHFKRSFVKNVKREGLSFKKYLDRVLYKLYGELSQLRYNLISNSMMRLENSVLVLIKLNGNIAAYFYGIKDCDAVRIMQMGYERRYSFYSPLFYGLYDYICRTSDEDNGRIRIVDFTRGDEPYKFQLAGGLETQVAVHHFIVETSV